MVRRLTIHFTLEEFVFSQTATRRGIDNTPPPEAVDNLMRVARMLEDVRDLLGGIPVLVSSGYRSPQLNAVIAGSSPTSAHMAGLAADFIAPGFGSPKEICLAIAGAGLEFDQVIHEFGRWVHLELAPEDRVPRRQLLSKFENTPFLSGIVDQP